MSRRTRQLVGGLEHEVFSPLGAAPRVVIVCVESMMQCTVRRPATIFLRILFATWKEKAFAMQAKATKADLQRMKKLLAKQSNSIWLMKKQDVVDLAISEIGMTRADADVETLTMFRERIRRTREFQAQMDDPLVKIPIGLLDWREWTRKTSRKNVNVAESR